MKRPVLSVPKAPQVSDHALVRFLQRSGMDVEVIRSALEDSLATAHGAAQAIGGGDHLILASDMIFVVRGGVVTTAIPDADIASRARILTQRDRTQRR